MHAFERPGLTIHYHADLSGDVEIVVGDTIPTTVRVPGQALVEFVTEAFFKPELVRRLEAAGPEELLDCLVRPDAGRGT